MTTRSKSLSDMIMKCYNDIYNEAVERQPKFKDSQVLHYVVLVLVFVVMVIFMFIASVLLIGVAALFEVVIMPLYGCYAVYWIFRNSSDLYHTKGVVDESDKGDCKNI